MKNSLNLSDGSKSSEVQLPLKGFRVPHPVQKEGWRTLIEGMGEGRYRIHMTKIKK